MTQHPDVQSLDMIPRVNIIEDVQFRKALPKSYKMFTSEAPFSVRLGNIKDGQKFMNALSADMLLTTVSREARHFSNEKTEKDVSKKKVVRMETLDE